MEIFNCYVSLPAGNQWWARIPIFFPVEIQTEGWQARVAGLDTGKLT